MQDIAYDSNRPRKIAGYDIAYLGHVPYNLSG